MTGPRGRRAEKDDDTVMWREGREVMDGTGEGNGEVEGERGDGERES